MKVRKNNNGLINTVIADPVNTNSIEEFAYAMLTFTEILRDVSLSKTEKRFMIVSIKALSLGYSLYDKDCIEYIIENSEFNTKFAIDKHRMNLIKNKWINKKGHKFNISNLFNVTEYAEEVDVSLKIVINNG